MQKKGKQYSKSWMCGHAGNKVNCFLIRQESFVSKTAQVWWMGFSNRFSLYNSRPSLYSGVYVRIHVGAS